jgi:hypothetical protein
MPFDSANFQILSPVSRVLMDGRQQLQNGWVQRAMRQRGGVCMIGALLPIADYEIHRLAEKLIHRAMANSGYAYPSVVAFNDDSGRTKEEVLKVYDMAITLSMGKT